MENQREMFECRLCGHEIMHREWGGGECAACGSVSVASVPTEESLNDFYYSYNDSYEGGGSSGGRNLTRYAMRYLRLVQRFAGPGELIDVGSSTSPFPNFAGNAGFSVTVMDYVRPKGLDPVVRFVAGNINNDGSSHAHAQKYDVVTAWAVLEHTPNPRLACRILSDLCRPGGLIFLSTPETGTWLTRNSIGRSGWFYPPEHLHLLSPLATKAIFAENNSDLHEWGRFEINSFRYLIRYGIGLVESIVGLIVKTILPAQWKALRKDRIQKFNGISYFVFRKREKVGTICLDDLRERREPGGGGTLRPLCGSRPADARCISRKARRGLPGSHANTFS